MIRYLIPLVAVALSGCMEVRHTQAICTRLIDGKEFPAQKVEWDEAGDNVDGFVTKRWDIAAEIPFSVAGDDLGDWDCQDNITSRSTDDPAKSELVM